MNRGGIQREQLIGIVPLAAVAEVVIYSDELTPFQFFDGAAHGAVRDTAGLGDGLPAGIATLCFVMTAQQVAVDGKGYGRQLVHKDFPWQHDERFSFHFLLLHFSLIKSPSTI